MIFVALCVICGLSPVTYTVGLTAAAIYALYYPARFRRRFKHQLQKQYAGGDAKGLLGPHELEVLADSFIERTPYNEMRTAWGAIEKIESTPEHTFIYLNSFTAHIIPHHAIVEGDFTAFMEKVRQSYRSDTLLTETKCSAIVRWEAKAGDVGMEPKTGKRIVSKGEYIKAQGQLAGLNVLGIGMLIAAAGFGILAVMVIFWTIVAMFSAGQQHGLQDLVMPGIVALTLSGITYLCGKAGIQSLNQAQQIDPGVPFTRANTADLPAPDSLVRAAEEPMQAQEAVLLRAAAQEMETPPEQLVRASVAVE